MSRPIRAQRRLPPRASRPCTHRADMEANRRRSRRAANLRPVLRPNSGKQIALRPQPIAARAADCVRPTLLFQNSARGSLLASLKTCARAARWTTTSTPSNFRYRFSDAKFTREISMTSFPREMSSGQRCRPRNPDAPVTAMRVMGRRKADSEPNESRPHTLPGHGPWRTRHRNTACHADRAAQADADLRQVRRASIQPPVRRGTEADIPADRALDELSNIAIGSYVQNGNTARHVSLEFARHDQPLKSRLQCDDRQVCHAEAFRQTMRTSIDR